MGLSGISPFVTKAQILLQSAGLDYKTDFGFFKAPKNSSYINDDGEIVADSTFIHDHIERKYGADFDRGLSAREKATGWALERMCE